MTIEDEIIFNVIHLAIHFLEGGAGARFVSDIYVYDKCECNWQYVENELKKLKLLDFYNEMSGMSKFWYGSDEYRENYENIVNFVMSGRTFGASQNAKALAVESGRISYLKNMFFPSYDEMCSLYPWLKKKAILLPFAWIKRGVNTILNKKGSILRSIKTAMDTDRNQSKAIKNFYKECGLEMSLRNK